MAAFTAKDVQALRETTSCGMMDCKKALTEAEGDMEKAIVILREKGLAASQKKAGRIAAEGTVYALTTENGVGAILEVNAETDFVAKNDKFMQFVKDCTETVAEVNPADLDTLMTTKVSGRNGTVEEELRELILVIGENMKVRRFERYEGAVSTYVHGGGRIGAMVAFNVADNSVVNAEEFKEMGRDVAMQIAAINPAYLDEKSVPAEVIENEKEIILTQMENDEKTKNKPEQVKSKMVEGKVNKYYKENCLVNQAFIKDGNLTVSQFVSEVGKKLGTEITISKFVRFEKGEGIEKREDNFADEVASMVK